jgi:L-ascorbate metabolism protein UlaG (beta-lactamase superfamily)
MAAQNLYETDHIPTPAGDLEITFLGHGSLLFNYNGLNIYVDPFSRVADYSNLPKADVILITHEHGDHLDPDAIQRITTGNTAVVLTELAARQMSGDFVMRNGDSQTVKGIPVQAVPAYNRVHTRDDGTPFHPKGDGNGYTLTFGDRRVYVAGDTEDIPEMQNLADIDIAFLPMNLPYTMTPEMTAAAARTLQPKVLYPYHFGQTDTSILENLLKGSGIEVRIRKMS